MPDSGIAGVVLAGGLGRRLGAPDKGLQPFRGRPLVQHAIERLRPQVAALAINANQNLERYAEFAHPVLTDRVGGFAGPLAGLEAGLVWCPEPMLVSVPCDSPFFPLDLVVRLRRVLEADRADLVVARTGAQAHPVFCLCRRELLQNLQAFLAGGGRKMDAWYAQLPHREVSFDNDAAAFSNINTPDELAAIERADVEPRQRA